MLTLVLFLGFVLFTWLLTALVIRLAMRWVRVERPTFHRAVGVVLTIWLVALPFTVVAFGLRSAGSGVKEGVVLGASLGLFLVQTVLTCLLIRWIARTSWKKAIVIWSGAMLAGGVAIGVGFFGMKPYVVEAFVVPTNSMAPTIKGWHEIGTCPRCGQSMTIPAVPPGDETHFMHDTVGICDHCWKTSADIEPSFTRSLLSPDRIMNNKWLTPRRWDLVVYRTPNDPNVKYVKRLVGLPGETVVIKEGAIWIDGVKRVQPEPIALLEYLPAPPSSGPMEYATEENPLKLGAGECFVLGDFPQRAADSRFTGPVPWENIEGVLGLCYWPPHRWKLWR